jgi:hypothetical protein
MPSGRLSESYVQRVAVNWLASHYQRKLGPQVVLQELEVGVKSKTRFGRGRADGLIVAQLSNGSVHVASLEAKSSRTFLNISPSYRDEKWLLHAISMGVIGLVLTGLVGWSVKGWFWMWVFPLLVFITVGLVYLMITYDFSYYRPVDVINQVKRYPANEQWIALSTDAYNQLGAEEQRILHRECQKKGVGLLRVSAGEKVAPLETPQSQSLPRGCKDFLSCYVRAECIRDRLQETLETLQIV